MTSWPLNWATVLGAQYSENCDSFISRFTLLICLCPSIPLLARLSAEGRPQPRPLYARSIWTASSPCLSDAPVAFYGRLTYHTRSLGRPRHGRIPVAFETVNDRRSESQPVARRRNALSRRIRAAINSS